MKWLITIWKKFWCHFIITDYQMCDGDYKFVVWVQRPCVPLVRFPLIPQGGDEHDGLVHEGLLRGTKQ